MSYQVIRAWLVGLVWLLATVVNAQANAQPGSAFELVEDTTVRVMDVVGAAEKYADEDPERYYQQVQEILDPLIDYRGFARQVMGPYASSKRYRSLDEPGKQRLRDQLDKFTDVMRSSLIRTYSKGLLAFGGSRIEVLPPEDDVAQQSRVSVRQLIYADRAEPYKVMYQMGQGKSGDWKLRNVIIESVNLGEIYRDQFLTSARDMDGNLDDVINSWTTVEVDVES